MGSEMCIRDRPFSFPGTMIRDGSLSPTRTERSSAMAIERLIGILTGFELPAFVRDHVNVVTQKRVRIRISHAFVLANGFQVPGIRLVARWQVDGGQSRRVVHGCLLIHYK